MDTTLRADAAKAVPCPQILMYILQCPHDVDIHLLFYFDIDLRL